MNEPGHVVAMAPEGKPVDSLGGLVAGVLHIAQVQHRVKLIRKGLHAELICGEVLRLIQGNLKAFCSQLCSCPDL